MGIGALSGGDIFRWDLKTSCIKNNEYKSQAKKKKFNLISFLGEGRLSYFLP